jgi:RNA polymerase sigma factor (sigma-70 family)
LDTSAPQAHDFAATLEEHRKLLLKVARMYGRDEDDRDDLIQETMIQLWRSWSSFDGRSRLSTWVYRIALNVAISWSRNEFRRNREVQSMDDAAVQEAACARSEDRAAADLDLLERMFRALNELDRAVMLLHLEGHAHPTIAEVLGISNTNVATKISRIRLRLQQQFSGQ